MREGEGDEEERDGESARCKGGDTLASLQGRPSTISRWKRRALAAREENSNLAGGVSERARAREGESEGERQEEERVHRAVQYRLPQPRRRQHRPPAQELRQPQRPVHAVAVPHLPP